MYLLCTISTQQADNTSLISYLRQYNLIKDMNTQRVDYVFNNRVRFINPNDFKAMGSPINTIKLSSFKPSNSDYVTLINCIFVWNVVSMCIKYLYRSTGVIRMII